MAKSKTFEIEYRAEGKRRADVRKKSRKELHSSNLFKKRNGLCPYCGGQMTWCEGCRMWSSDCCEEYGTCMCS